MSPTHLVVFNHDNGVSVKRRSFIYRGSSSIDDVKKFILSDIFKGSDEVIDIVSIQEVVEGSVFVFSEVPYALARIKGD